MLSFFQIQKSIPELDIDEMCKAISDKIGLELNVVRSVVDAELEYMIENGYAG